MICAVRKDDINIFQTQSLEGLPRSLYDTTYGDCWSAGVNQKSKAVAHCLRDRPMSFGPFLTPQNSFVVMIRSERRKFSSLITRPLFEDRAGRLCTLPAAIP